MSQAISLEKITHCPYCGSDRLGKFLEASDLLNDKPGTFYLSRCQGCDLMFQNPRVKEEDIGQFYEDLGYYTPPPKKPTSSILSKLKHNLEVQSLVNQLNYHHLGKPSVWGRVLTKPFLRKLRIQLMPDFVPDGKLLDIGCSHGSYLVKMRDLGWIVTGIEMDEKAAQYARDKHNLDVKTARIEESEFQPGEFDVIVMSMVLEHLYDPFEKLRIMTQWLKPGGQLIFSIPYFGGIEFKMFGRYSYGLQLPTHITFFNRKIIRDYLARLGFKNIRIDFQSVDRDVVASANYRYQDTKGAVDKILAQNKVLRKLAIRPLIGVLSLFGKTSRISVSATSGDFKS